MNLSAQSAYRRGQRATAARLLLSLHKSSDLENPDIWTWNIIDRLPSWCLLSAEDRQQLQRVCGALYLSPEMRFWIDKSRMRALQTALGDTLFDRIMAHADEMRLPREPVSLLVKQRLLNLPMLDSVELDALLLSAGATVFAATVHESLPLEMLLASLGETLGAISSDTAHVLQEVASTFIDQALNSQAIAS